MRLGQVVRYNRDGTPEMGTPAEVEAMGGLYASYLANGGAGTTLRAQAEAPSEWPGADGGDTDTDDADDADDAGDLGGQAGAGRPPREPLDLLRSEHL